MIPPPEPFEWILKTYSSKVVVFDEETIFLLLLEDSFGIWLLDADEEDDIDVTFVNEIVLRPTFCI